MNSSLTTTLKTDKRGRVRTPVAEREALMDLFDQGGMSGAAFARLHGLRYPTFANWRAKRLKRAAQIPKTGSALFHEVLLEPATRHGGEGVVIELPLGARVRLERADQIPLIAVLCRHLREGAPC
jgi:hypothetical protein